MAKDGEEARAGGALAFSVVVPTFNGGELLRACLKSIAALDFPRARFEVLVVDNKSTDATPAIIDSFGFTRLEERTHQSSYAARNVGIRAARGEFIAFTDSDCEVAPDWLTELLAAARDNPNAGCIAGEILAFPPSTPVERYSEKIGLLRQRGPLSGWHFKPYAQTANAAYRRDVFDRIGVFEPTMKSGGDAEIAWRMLDKTDYEIKFAPDAKVYHHHRTSVRDLWAQFHRYGGGKLSWARARTDYTPPQWTKIQDELVDALDTHAAALMQADAEEERYLFPLFGLVSKAAHLSGYTEDILRALAPGATPAEWAALAARGAPAASSTKTPSAPLPPTCVVCGASAYAPGPGGRLAYGAPPQCKVCGSLERHRAMHALLAACKSIGAGDWRCLALGETMRPQSRIFRETVLGSAGHEIGAEHFDIVSGVGHFERATQDSISAALHDLSLRLKPSGLLVFAHAMAPPPPRTSRKPKGGWSVGADFGCLASRALPEFSIISLRVRDEPTGVLTPATAMAMHEKPLQLLAERVQSAGGAAEFISI